MATLANILDRFTLTRVAGIAPARVPAQEREAQFALRAIPNEDVFFYVKRIDNSSVQREADPRAGRACWRMIGISMAAALCFIVLLLPSLYGMLAGYRLEGLRQEHQRLENERTTLDLEEARLLSPQRLSDLARKQAMVDPPPQSVIYLDGKPEGTLARR